MYILEYFTIKNTYQRRETITLFNRGQPAIIIVISA